MSDKKYIVHPGNVISQNDGDYHFIGFGTLCRLYGVPLNQCINAGGHGALIGRDTRGMTHLYPKYNGRYTLPATNEATQ